MKAVPEGPVFERADVRINVEDVPQIMAASEDFARRHDFSFEAGSGPHGFTVLMDRGKLSIAAYNTVHRDIAYLKAWHRGQLNDEDRMLARNYIALIKSTI